jgi:hypothetical protein
VAGQSATTWEGVVAGDNKALTSVAAGNGSVMHRYLDEGILSQLSLTHSGCSREKPRSGTSGSDDGNSFGVALPLGGIFLEQLLDS